MNHSPRSTDGTALYWHHTDTFATAAAIAAVLIDNAIPTAAAPPGAGGDLPAGTEPRARSAELSRG
jgi:hypothetical protein